MEIEIERRIKRNKEDGVVWRRRAERRKRRRKKDGKIEESQD